MLIHDRLILIVMRCNCLVSILGTTYIRTVLFFMTCSNIIKQNRIVIIFLLVNSITFYSHITLYTSWNIGRWPQILCHYVFQFYPKIILLKKNYKVEIIIRVYTSTIISRVYNIIRLSKLIFTIKHFYNYIPIDLYNILLYTLQ